jgi:hypothetical protein
MFSWLTRTAAILIYLGIKNRLKSNPFFKFSLWDLSSLPIAVWRPQTFEWDKEIDSKEFKVIKSGIWRPNEAGINGAGGDEYTVV